MCFLLHYCADDTPLARVNIESFDQQTRFELIVADMVGKTAFYQTGTDDFRPLSDWNGITLDSDGNVSSVKWNPFGKLPSGRLTLNPAQLANLNHIPKAGSIEIQWLPSSVTTCTIHYLHLSGTVDTSGLPRGLTSLEIRDNRFHGPFDITGLPQAIEHVSIAENSFDGSLLLSALPSRIERFNATSNRFNGSLGLTTLPDTLTELYLPDNAFEGTINLENIPPSLCALTLMQNNLRQKNLVVGMKKKNMLLFNVDWENFESVVDVDGVDMG
uniref:Leucine-rich repeat protein n=1 Tax=Paramoeba aestuarina TaxID=180227 RepID=A0A7S4NWC0_9EUKA|mmetsp:Transcript_29389/g.45428  ORF Transcript_29389/g.45428 Transcript_29389/m.45428 type:complete len:272 (+) Transcript_29389:29-844(+)